MTAPVAELVPPDEQSPLSPIVFTPNGQDVHACFTDAVGQVFTLDFSAACVTAQGAHALAFGGIRRGAYLVGRSEGATGNGAWRAGLYTRNFHEPGTTTLEGDLEQAFIGHEAARNTGAFAAVRHAHGGWELPLHEAVICHPPGRVVGATSLHIVSLGSRPRPFLLLLEEDRRTLRVWWNGATLPIAVEPQPIVHACAATSQPRVAYQLADGTVVVSGMGAEGQAIRHASGSLA